MSARGHQGLLMADSWSPALLFKGGERGAWYDPSDLSTLFQDSAGTIPVTATGQRVARMSDKSGNGQHLINATPSSGPTYQTDGSGRAYLAFSGAQWLQVANTNKLYLGTACMALLTACQFASSASDQSPVARSKAAGGTAGQGRYGIIRDAANNGLLSVYQATTSGTQNSPVQADTSTVTRVLTQLVDRQTAYNSLFINANEYRTTYASDVATNNTQALRFILGAYGDATDSGQMLYFVGSIYGAIVRMTTTTDTQNSQRARTWLGAKCGISI